MKSRATARHVTLAPDIAFKQAAALAQQGNLSDAETIYRTILKRHRNHFPTLYNLARVVTRAQRFEDAIEILHKAISLEPNSAEAQTLLASALRNLERYDEALACVRRAVAANSGFAGAHLLLSELLSELGRYDEARSAQARAIELAPDEPRQYYRWGLTTRWTADDPRLAALEALAQRSLSLNDQVYVNFALAKAYADCGDIERAFRRQIAGAALKRRTLRYDEALTFRQWDELRRAFDAEWLRRHQGVGDPSPLPVFILGMPRSGTTLVEQILASHPAVRALGERTFLQDALTRLRGKPDAPLSLSQVAAHWSDPELRRLGAFYLQAARRGAPPSVARITDKVTEHFRFVGLIHACLPNARIIHTGRDPVDTCLSIFSMLFWGGQQPYSYDLGELGRYYRAYETMMAHWRGVLPAGVMIDVKYEDVVDDLERQARRIIAHCGLDWDDACLEFHKTDRPVRTASHAQVRQPIYRSSVGRQRPPRELLLPLLEALGLD